MEKKIITGRIALAVLLCAVLLTGVVPQEVYAGEPPYGSYGVPAKDSYDGFVTTESSPVSSTGTSYNDGIIDSDRAKGDIYYGDGFYTTDISSQLKDKAEEKGFWEKTADMLNMSGIESALSQLFYAIASGLHLLFDEAGIALDNIIFGRVNGFGTRVVTPSESPDGRDVVVSLFRFEMETGNPYGVIAAMIYSVIRKYMYILMIVISFALFVRVAWTGDNPTAKKDFRANLGKLFQVFALVVFMPYFLEVGLYIRDIILHGVVGESMFSLFGSNRIGLLQVFKENCGDRPDLFTPALMSSLLYLAATCLSLVFAVLYVTNALSLFVQVVAFPVVCVKSLFDNKALSSWTWEVVGLASMPIIDGILIFIPLLLNKAANGTVGLNFVSLIACGCLMAVRQQFRKAIGLQSNNALEAGGLMTAMGMARLISSVGRAGKRAIGQAAGGFKQGASDDAMASYYEAQAAMDTFNKQDAEAQVDNGYFNARGGVAENPAAKTGMGAGMGLSGDLSYKAQKLNDINTKLSTPHETSADNVHVSDMTNVAPSMEKTKREQDLRDAQVTAVMGKKAPVQDNVADTFANIDNFESQEFANKLSNAKKAQLYRERAQNARRQGLTSSFATAGGAIAGGMTAFAATAYMDSGTSAMITSAGVDLGASAGPALSNMVASRRMSKDAKTDRTVSGEGSELGYTIKTAEDGAHLYTYSRFNDQEGERLEAFVDMTDLPAVHKARQKNMSNGEMVTTEGWYETNGAKIVDAYESAAQTDGPQISGPQTDTATGEYYYTVDGSSIRAEGNGHLAIGQNMTANVTVKPFENAKEDFVNYMNSEPDLKDSFEDNFADAVSRSYNDDKLKAIGNNKYEEAKSISNGMKTTVNLDAALKEEGNRRIDALHNEVRKDVFMSIYGPTREGVDSTASALGIDIPPQEQLNIDVVTEFLANNQTERYISEQGWDFDSLVVK